jgi:branched-chain amino acid transport system substrate-binding protein
MAKKSQIVAVLLALISLAAGCSPSGSSTGTSSAGSAAGSSGTTSNSSGGDYKIGMTVDLSGTFSNTGQGERAGAQAFIDHLNASGGINGHKVDLTVLDDAGTPTRGAANTTQLITQQGVSGVIGYTISNICAAGAPIAQSSQVPLVCQSLPDNLLYPAQDYLFSEGAAVSAQAGPIVAVAKKVVPSVTKVAIVAIASSATESLADSVKSMAAASGWKVGTQAAAVAAAKPDVVFGLLDDPLEIPLMRELKAGGLNVPVVGYSPIDYDSLSVVKSPLLYTVLPFSAGGSAGTGYSTYRAIVSAAKQNPYATFVASGYENAEIVTQALKACGYPCSGSKLNDALNSLTYDDAGLSGSVLSYSKTSHQAIHALFAYDWDAATNAPHLVASGLGTGK